MSCKTEYLAGSLEIQNHLTSNTLEKTFIQTDIGPGWDSNPDPSAHETMLITTAPVDNLRLCRGSEFDLTI